MSRQFDEALNECLEALRSGRLTLQECLDLYPQWRGELEPLLRVAVDVATAYREEEALSAARQAGRRRLLEASRTKAGAAGLWGLAALRLRLAPTGVWLRPAVAGVGLLFLVFVGFSTYTVATSSQALPGDWRYAVKRFTERTRLALAFDNDSKRGLRIDFVAERLEELETLAARQRPINGPVLRELASSTQRVVSGIDPASLPPEDDLSRISELTDKQKDVLAQVEPLVVEQAADDLQAALTAADEGHEIAVTALAQVTAPPPDATPGVEPSGTPVASGATPGPEASETPGAAEATPTATGATPESTPTPVATTPPAVEPSPEPAEPPELVLRREIVPLPDDTTAGLSWNLIVIDNFSVAVPTEDYFEGDGWAVSSPLSRDAGEVLRGVVVAVLFDDQQARAVVAVRVADGGVSLLVGGEPSLRPIDVAQIGVFLPPEIADAVRHIIDSVKVSPS